MSIKNKIIKGIKEKFYPLVHAHDTQSLIPMRMKLEIEKVSQGLAAFGPRKLRRMGPGMEFYEARPFQDGDEPSERNARLSLQHRQPMSAKREAEISQHIYMWVCRKNRMNYVSEHLKKLISNGRNDTPEHAFTKGQAAEIMLLALAKHLCRNEEAVGLLDVAGTYRGGNADAWLSQKLNETAGIKCNMPAPQKNLPRNSTAILFSDFIMSPDELEDGLDRLGSMGLTGYLVMVLDPAELDFSGYRGRVEFLGMDGEETVVMESAEDAQKSVQELMKEHIESVRAIATSRNFKFILQRTDMPLHQALLAVYGVTPPDPQMPESKPSL